ncbi:MAG: hypothetical protein IJ567_06355 [Lachnospiraceae bacterium]|nr:hypothetical protein [Lachnospiraceae bacterium]
MRTIRGATVDIFIRTKEGDLLDYDELTPEQQHDIGQKLNEQCARNVSIVFKDEE